MTLAQIPVIGDIHLHPDQRQPARLRAIDQILDEGLALPHLAAWAIPGDLFDARSDIASRNALAARLLRMAEAAPVCIVYGNHDCGGDLDIFGKLGSKYRIHVVDRPKVLTLSLATGQVLTVFALNYPNAGTLVAMGTPPEQVPVAARASLEAIFIDAGRQLEDARRAGHLTLFLGHINISGAIVSTGQPMIGSEIELDEALLRRLGDCPKVVNHVHKAQEISGAVYPGSVSPQSFGETEAKRYVVVEYAGPAAWVIASHPIHVPRLFHVEARYAAGAFTYDIVLATIPPESEVRVRARYAESERTFFEMGKAQLYADFATASRLQVEPVCEPDRALRSPEVAAEKTLLGKFGAWCRVNALAPPPGLPNALAALEHGEPDLVVSAFQQQIDALVTPSPLDADITTAVDDQGRLWQTRLPQEVP